MRNLLRTLILILGIGWLNITYAQQAPICATDVSGGTGVHSEGLNVSEDLIEQLQIFQSDLKTTGQAANRLRDQLLVLTTRPGQTDVKTNFQKLHNQRVNLAKQSELLIKEIPRAYRDERQNIIAAMMKLNATLLQTESFLQPYALTLTGLQNRYSLAITREQFEDIYPLGLDLPEGLNARLEKTKSQVEQYRLILSNEHVFRAQTRAAAQSPETRASGKAYMETTRCTLNRLLLGKLTLNHALIGASLQSPPVAANTKLCLNTTAGELLELTRQDADIRKENTLREVVSQNLPTSMMNFTEKTFQFLEESDFAQYLGQLRVFPEKLRTLNYQRLNNDQPEIPVAAAETAIQELNSDLENQFRKYADLQPLRHIWNDPRLVTSLMPLLEDCQYTFTSYFAENQISKSLQAQLVKSEDFYFVNNLAFDLKMMIPRLTEMSEAELQQTMQNYIISRRRAATYQSLIAVLGYYQAPASADLELWLAAAQDRLQPVIAGVIEERLAKSRLEQFVQNLVKTLLSQQTLAKNMQLLLDGFTTEMIRGSKKIKPYLDPETAHKDLPYDESAMVRTLNPMISQMDSQRVGAMQILFSEKDPGKRRSLFQKISGDLASAVKAKGLKCEVTGGLGYFFSQKADQYILDRQTSDRTRATTERLQNDCFNVQTVGVALGLQQNSQKFQSYADVEAALTGRMTKKELKILAQAYRVALADPILGEYRLLDQELENSKIFNKTKMYQYLAEQNPENPSAVRQTIQTAVQKSILNLKDLLKITANARTPQDLNFFITRTRVINAVLGENDLSTYLGVQNGIFATERSVAELMQDAGFVFPQLLLTHQKLQNEMIMREDLHNEVWEEFLGANGMIVMGVAGGWAAKHALGVLPRWVGGPALSGWIDKLGANTINLIAGHGWFLMGLLATHIPTLEYKKWEYRTELNNVNELTAAETLKPEGAENPIPLIEWEDYRSQYNLFKARIRAAKKAQLMDAMWLTFAGTQNLLIRKGTTHIARGSEKLNVRLEKMSGPTRVAYEQWLRFRYHHTLNRLSSDLRVLKSPEALDASTLLANYNRLHAQARTFAQKSKLDRAYERVVTKLGSGLENVINNPQLKELHAKALFGPHGSAQQIDDMYREYIRILQKQNAAVGL